MDLQSRFSSRLLSKISPRRKRVSEIGNSWAREDGIYACVEGSKESFNLNDYEYSYLSQNGEDGILRRIFEDIGFESKRFLEFGFSPLESNSLRLMLLEGFEGVFIDGCSENVDSFNFAVNSHLPGQDVKAVKAFLDKDNINKVIRSASLEGEIDLLSIDVDGNDFWFWESINEVNSRVVVIEYNASLGPKRSITVPYDRTFRRHEKHLSGFYCGASLAALEKLGIQKGYSLVCCDTSGVNAFFVRNDCVTSTLKAISVEDAYFPHRKRIQRGFSTEEQFSEIESLPFLNI